jgi:CRISPR-associated endonuclease/helicase Cas3
MRTTFDEVFRKATGGEKSPYRYQRVLAMEAWPDALTAPTGFGKTAAVIISWLYKRLVEPDETPRRLVLCLPMRTLVDQTVRNAEAWCKAIAAQFCDAGQEPPTVHPLLGGRVDEQWSRRPEWPAIIVGTQDMLLSRALMRGYGLCRFRWSVDFALLHNDALWVFDEVQLMNSGLATSAQIEAFRRDRRRFSGTVYPSRTLWMSATFDKDWLKLVDFAPHIASAKIVSVTGDTEPSANSLWTARKSLARAPVALKTANEKKGYSVAVAAVALDATSPGKTVLVIVNRVARAQDIFLELRRQAKKRDIPLQLLLIHSRFRPAERANLTDRLRVESSSTGRIVVSTQAVEAGVDITSSAMVSELAPWSSLVQRFGRCNRYGEESDARVFWIDIDGDDDLARPYNIAALEDSRDRLSSLDDVGLKSLAGLPPESFAHGQVIRAKDFINLFDTDPDLSGFDVDVSPYVRDTDDTDVRVFWRNLGEQPDLSKIEPAREELCAVSIDRARAWLAAAAKVLDRKLAFKLDPLAKGRATEKIWEPVDPRRIFPGQTLLIDVEAGGYDPELGFTGDRKDRPIPFAVSSETTGNPDILDGDESSKQKCCVGLWQHLTHVANEAGKICDALGLDPATRESITVGAAWHDVGKAHDEFQFRMGRDHMTPPLAGGAFLAKSRTYHRTGNRPYFRHELASALAWLQNERATARMDHDLVAYLIASHHGKVRMNLKALSGEAEPDDPSLCFARGVWEGDRLPTFDIPGWGHAPTTILSLGLMKLGRGPQGPSWAERTRRLLGELGPFWLAFLEALVCIADWRASEAEEARGQDDV